MDYKNFEELIIRAKNPLVGEVNQIGENMIPGDKSLSHRAALFAALAEGTSTIENFQVSGVTIAMLKALRDLHVFWDLLGNTLIVEGKGLYGFGDIEDDEKIVINCGNSATTMRLLAGALAATRKTVVLDGSLGLRRRPMKRIIEPLKAMGVLIEGVDNHAPITVRSNTDVLYPIEYTLQVASAQVKSAILLAGLRSGGETVVYEPGPSRDHTEKMLRGMGVEITQGIVQRDENGLVYYRTRLRPPTLKKMLPLNMTLPGDISAAAFLIVAALITPGSELILRRVGINPTRTGLIDVLLEMGADITISNLGEENNEPYGDIYVRASDLHGVEVKGSIVVRMIDEFPIFAVAAAFAQGKTVVEEAQELRYKESDRIASICKELSHVGVDIAEKEDGFIVYGGKELAGGNVESHGDHRLAMSLAVAGLMSKHDIRIKNAGIITESFPDFPEIMAELGAEVIVE